MSDFRGGYGVFHKMTEAKLSIPENRKELLGKYYTKEGIKLIEVRLNQLINLKLKIKKYPFRGRIWGMPPINIKSEEELNGRILEIKDFLMIIKIEIKEE